MTLIVSWIDKKGAHQCSDSRLFSNGSHTDGHRKIVSFLDGRILLGIAGSWGVGRIPMPNYIENQILPSFDESEIEDMEIFLKAFPKALAVRLQNDMTAEELLSEGTRLTIITQIENEFILSSIDIDRSNPNKHKIISSEIVRGQNETIIARGHETAEKAFVNEMLTTESNAPYNSLRNLISAGLHEKIIGGKVFCQHKLNNTYFQRIIEEISTTGELHEFKNELVEILKKFTDKCFDISVSNVSPGREGSETSINWLDSHLKININSDSRGLNLLWDILHEYGHLIDGMPEDNVIKSLNREVSAWLHAYQELNNLGLLKHRESFITQWNTCIKSYYDYNKYK